MKKNNGFRHIANTMREKRLTKCLTQSQIAKILGISQETVSRIERGDG